MSKTLTEIAQQLKDANKKVQLIYAFNGTGKTRLSREFKELIAPKNRDDENSEDSELSRKFLYYNAFTEDLFYWDNDLEADAEPKLKIQPNAFTDWLIKLLKELGEDGNIVTNFQRYTSKKVTPLFNETYSEVVFNVAANKTVKFDDSDNNESKEVQGKYETIKISKGEESNFIWSVIYALLEQVISTLNDDDATNRITDEFNGLEYVFIDDPVSSLDDSHLIESAVDLANLIKLSKSKLKFVVTTHNPLFYNVLYNELSSKVSSKVYKKMADGKDELVYNPKKAFEKYRLEKLADGNFALLEQPTGSPFSYHLFLLSELQSAINSGEIRKYHFSFVRNILEKMAVFLGYNYWPALLPKTIGDKPDPFANRILNLCSHSDYAGEETKDVDDTDKEKLDELVKYLIKTYGFKS